MLLLPSGSHGSEMKRGELSDERLGLVRHCYIVELCYICNAIRATCYARVLCIQIQI